MTSTLILAVTLLTAAADRVNPQPVATFDGKAWSGLTLGEMSDGELKKKFETDKGAVRPEGLRILATRGSGVRIDALLDGRGSKAVMRALRVQVETPMRMDQLADTLKESPLVLYAQDRWEDWRMLAFAERGILALEIEGRVDTYILMSPDRISAATRNFGEVESRVTNPPDPGRDWDRIIRFDNTYASVSLGSNRPEPLDSDWRRRLERRLENEAESLRASGLRYSSSGDGELRIEVTTERFNKDGEANFTVRAALTASTPYGSLSESVSKSKKFSSNYDRRVLELLDDATRDLAQDVRDAVRKLGPPPRDSLRKAMLDKVMELASMKPAE